MTARRCVDCATNPARAARLCTTCYNRHHANGSLDPYLRVASLPTTPAHDTSWHTDAICAQVDTEIFFPGKGEPTAPAKRVCSACPVVAECLDHALTVGETFGVWGGLGERERQRLKRDHRVGAA